MKKIIFVIPQLFEPLDLSGPVQVFTEAKLYGFNIEIEFYSISPNTVCSAGLPLGNIKNYKEAQLQESDFVFIPGMNFEVLQEKLLTENAFFKWLADCSKKNINICSVCNAAFFFRRGGFVR